MRPFLYERLARALLVEMASGVYREGDRFLSLREIRRLWDVSEPTARSSLAVLEEAELLRPVPRSGFRLNPGFQKQALLLLHQSPEISLPPASNWRNKRWRLLRSEKTSSQRRIGLIVEDQLKDPVRRRNSDLAALESMRTFFQEANRDDSDVRYFYQDGTGKREAFILNEIASAGLDAVVVFRRFEAKRHDSLLKQLASYRIPVVTVFDDYEQPSSFSINFNNVGAGYSAARLLLEDEPSRIVALLPERRSENFEQRLQGFSLGLSQISSGNSFEFEVVRVPSEGESLRIVRERVTGLRRPAALFAPGISTYVHLKSRAVREGWRLPRDLRVLGCGNPNLLKKREGNVELLLLDFSEVGRRTYRYVRKILDGMPVERMSLLPVPQIDRPARRREEFL